MSEQDDGAFWADQWAELMGMAATVTNAADSVMDAMRGDLGLPRGATTAQAAPIIKARITAYQDAKGSLIDYSQAIRSALEQAAEQPKKGAK